MEADWSAEIGPNLPIIEADWPGFVELRDHPESLLQIPEAAPFEAMREVLTSLNAPASPLMTAKCDIWTLNSDELDPSEFDFPPEEVRTGMACYIDILVRDPDGCRSFAHHDRWARAAIQQLRALPITHGRVDLIVRAADRDGQSGFGVTLYAAGCGTDPFTAQAAWEAVVRAAVTVTIAEAHPRASSSIG
ncbi:MAG TPA: hypothetical protein VK819_02375 [Acidobacteriaceae bacterium]|jgi:hypothetical protein|nr:hypothetical protein [Acidobacteriaceae bacterium]